MSRCFICYHAADFDGILSGYLARQAWNSRHHDSPVMLGVNYGDEPPLHLLHKGEVQQLCIVDFSWPMRMMQELSAAVPHLVWIDHHKTALEAYQAAAPFPDKDTVVLDVSKAACELVWEHFFPADAAVPGIQAIGAWDIKNWSRVSKDQAANFQYAVRLANPSCEDSETWDRLLRAENWQQHQDTGDLLRRWERQGDKRRAAHFHTVAWAGYRWRVQVGPATPVEVMWEVDPGDYDGVIGVNFIDGKWTVSLRRVPGSTVDLSEIAKRHGGGGHPGAAGFSSAIFPASLFVV